MRRPCSDQRRSSWSRPHARRAGPAAGAASPPTWALTGHPTPAAPVAMAADTTPPAVTAPVASPRTNAVSAHRRPVHGVVGGDRCLRDRPLDAPGQVDGGSWETISLPSATATSASSASGPRTSTRSGCGQPTARTTRASTRGPDVPGAAPRRDDDRPDDDRRLAAARERGLSGRRGAGRRRRGRDGDVRVHRQPGRLDRDPGGEPRAGGDRPRRRAHDDHRPRAGRHRVPAPRVRPRVAIVGCPHAYDHRHRHGRATRTWTSTGSSSSIRPRSTRCSSAPGTSRSAA